MSYEIEQATGYNEALREVKKLIPSIENNESYKDGKISSEY
jgi:hypothetical protein